MLSKKTRFRDSNKADKDELNVPKIKSEHSRKYDADVATRFARWVTVDGRRARGFMSEVVGASAYELRRRGYDVYAEPYTDAYNESPIQTLHRQFEFENNDINTIIGLDQRKVRRKLREELLNQGAGARGVIIISGNQNSPNSKKNIETKYQVLSYENGDNNGRVYYTDPITGRSGDFADYEAVISSNKIKRIQYCRLDDKKVKDYRKNLIYDASSHKNTITKQRYVNEKESRDAVLEYEGIKEKTELLMAADEAAKKYVKNYKDYMHG